MDFTLLIGIAAIIFITGIILIAKGISVQDEKAVPISDLEELVAFKGMHTTQSKSPQLHDSRERKKRSEGSNSLTIESMASQQISTDEIQRLRGENAQLKVQINDQKNKFEILEQRIAALQNEQVKIKESASNEVKILEQKIMQIQQEKEKLLTNRELLDELKSKNEMLQRQYVESQAHQTDLKVIINQLEEEKNALLKMQKSGIDKPELDDLGVRLANSIAMIEVLKSENKGLQHSHEELKRHYQMLEDFNQQLQEKGKLMQYELIKNRAQALGLEKICEDFKMQIESRASTTLV